MRFPVLLGTGAMTAGMLLLGGLVATELNPVPVVNKIGAAADEVLSRFEIGKCQSVLFGVASVATSRRPSALAASDVYRSMPGANRWGIRRSTSIP